ncbi:MAG TPA: 2-oxoacid:ferredoxin oxidoreductase subunit alpha [Nitrososphaerales archaeon]|nr:2-oxoacid:ferredoxin oxidoreductase subunit alpha [Nitrososphaerales archaeon]
MKRDDFSWMIGGAQGSGVDTPASIFAKAVATAGFYVYGTREYYSNIKGEHSYFQVRFGTRFLRSHVNTVDMLATFDDETVARHAFEVREGGAIIFDKGVAGNKIQDIPTIEPNVMTFLKADLDKNGLPYTIDGVLEVARRRGVHIYPIQYMDILKSVGDKLGETSMSSLTRMTNVLSVASSFALLSFPKEIVGDAIRKQFKSKPKVAAMNVAAVDETYAYLAEHFMGGIGYKFAPGPTNRERRVLIRGTTAVGIGKVAAGCRLQTYYPITPASDESEYLEEHESIDLYGAFGTEAAVASKGSVVVIQTEDETAAVLMAIGGGLAGVRAATSTSGPGFCLMAEGIGWAGMNEVPVVVTLYQRGGPSTGLPTRHAQGDLRFALHIGHDEFPRIILASGDIEESFYDVTKAFNFAERYQVPVIHLLDKGMANADQTYPMFDPNQMKIDRGSLIKGSVRESDDKGFKRFEFTQTGISPRPAIGAKGGIFWNSGDEHDEKGHISEDPTNRMMMMEKRMGKLDVAAREIPLDDKIRFYGPEDAPVTVVSWGSTKGAILDAMDALKEQDGISVNFLQLRLMSPFPTEEVKEALSRSKKLVDIEMNYSGQFAGLLREMTGITADYRVVKYNGRPMSLEEVYDSLKQISSSPAAKGQAPKRMVLRNGT